MPGTNQRMRWCGRFVIAGSLLFALLAGGCSSNSNSPSASQTDTMHGYSGSGSITDLLGGSSAKGPQTVAGAQPDVNCPPVEVRQGASTLTIGQAGDKSAMSLRYQGDFLREARECSIVNGSMVMRIGVEGRVIVGPAGGPGQVDVPLRFAVVQETPGGARPITTKFIRVPVAVTNDGNTAFTHIEDGVTFPVPTPTSLLDDYIAYIGFDPLSAEQQEKPKPKPKPTPKRSKPSASANGSN
jgi:hypothetical protein